MNQAIELIDEFLTTVKDRGSMARVEIADILLDVRLAITKEEDASLQEESGPSTRSDIDDRGPTAGTPLEPAGVGS